jgi:acyl-CoA synthetase (AMP-forming)/AMP-acid ligase II
MLRRGRFDAGEVLDLLERERPNVVVGVPTMYADLETAGARDRDLSHVQLWISAADVMPVERARRFQRYGALARVGPARLGTAVFLDVFGMVELSGPAAVRVFPPSLVGSVPAPAVSVALPGIEVRAVDENGVEVPAGHVGHLQWRGAAVLEGYAGHRDAGSDDDAGPEGDGGFAGGDAGRDDDGWFAGGDRGRVWRGGVFQLVGRDRDRLKVGGFSVFPAEVEDELRDAPDVVDLAIVGVPDERSGERLVAVVVAGPGFEPDRFLAWTRERVAGYRRPQAVVTVDELPRGNHGKLDREAATASALQAL